MFKPAIFKTTIFRAIALSAALVAGSVSAHAQSQSINGTIRGTVTDTTGAPVVGAVVTIKNLDTGFVRQAYTGGDGLYIAPNLPIGTYAVSAKQSGFAPLTQSGIHIEAGTSATVDEQLKAGSVATEILVTSDAPIIESTRVDLGRTISTAEVQNLPLTSRNPYNFILFQPGVSGHPNQENGVPRVLNTNGLIDRINYQLDGMVDTETDRYGLRLFAISDSYVREVQTIANSYAPEFGNTAGVIYNVITQSGTNQFHGGAQYIWRPKAASSCPMLQNCDLTVTGGKPKPDLHVDDFVGSVGGPVIKNKFFFYAAYEKLKRANPAAVTILPANQTTLIGLGVNPAYFNPAPSVQRAQWLDLRGDWTINSKNQFFVRYNYFRNNYPFNSNVGGLFALDSASDFQDRAHIIGAQLVTTFKPNLLNEFRGSWPYRNQHHVTDPLTGPGPMITISGIANFGGSNAAGDKFQEKIPSFNDNVTYIKGSHTFKFGTGFQKNLDTQLADIYTQYTFASITAYQNAKNGTAPLGYTNVKASIGTPGAAYHSIFFDFFAQDSWQIRRNLLATYGVRYDQYHAPAGLGNAPFAYTQSFRTPMGDFAPRLGLAYSPMPTTVVRLNIGMFYEATPTNTWYNPLYNNGLAGTGSFITSLGPTSSCAPNFPNSPASVSAACAGTQSIYAVTPKFKNEYVWNANTQVAQALSKNDSLTLGYIMTLGRNMQFQRNINLGTQTSTLADGRPVYGTTGQPYAGFGNITLIDVGSNSTYHALTATYDHRMSAGLSASASYTWSHAISNTPEGNTYEGSGLIEDPSNPKRDRGNSLINRPNSLTASIVYEPAFHLDNKIANAIASGNNLAILANMSSGDQQNITTATNLNGDSASSGTQRPLFTGRNSVRGPSIYQFDARYTRTFAKYHSVQSKLFIEANNLANRSNTTTINTTAVTNGVGVVTTQPSFAKTSTVLESRILQFGLRIDF